MIGELSKLTVHYHINFRAYFSTEPTPYGVLDFSAS
jgi:hypothetical protein